MVSVNDFNIICRICLQPHDKMVDIFGSGIDNQLMEITKLKVQPDDKLPKTLCQNCRDQMEYFSEFQERAKLSDVFLRSLLSNNDCKKKYEKNNPVTNNQKTRSKKKKQKFSSKEYKHKKKSDVEEENELYLIVVPQTDKNDISDIKKEIYIKDLSIESDDLELTDFCKNLVKNYFIDNRYSGDNLNFSESIHVKENKVKCELFDFDTNFKNSTNQYLVNMFIFNCKECDQSFDKYCDLSDHYLSVHKCEKILVQEFSYKCPVCNCYKVDEKSFLIHLEMHQKKEGFQFFDIYSMGEKLFLNDKLKTNVFSAYKADKEIMSLHKIIRLNLDTFICSICFEKIESKKFILDHMKLFHREIFVDNYFINYVCPVCSALFVDEKDKFIDHLILHKQNDFHFIKVSSMGEPIKLEENEDIFVPHEEALDIIKLVEKKNKFFTVMDMCSCEKCDYSTQSFQSLKEHYLLAHLEVEPNIKNSLSCPACFKEFKTDKSFEIKVEFYEHLKVHKDENFKFIEVSNTGFIKPSVEGYADIFSQSKILYDLSKGLLTIDLNQIYYPECGIFKSDMCHEKDLWENQFEREKKKINYFMPQSSKNSMKDNLTFVCEKCGKVFSGEMNYKKHYWTHLDVDDSQKSNPVCELCNKSSTNRTTLCGHLGYNIQQGEKDKSVLLSQKEITCDQCGKTFSNRTSLTKHQRMHRTGKENSILQCEICSRKFLWQTSYHRHKSAHFNPKYSDCDICKLPLSSASSLQKHIKTHKSTGKFDCKTCKSCFLTKDSLTAHQALMGHHQDRKPMECNVCHEKFFIGRKFMEHIKTHPKYKMEKCTLCGKRLSTVQSLMLHMSRHFESNSILCPHCGKQFFEERNYHRHLLTHEGIKPFGCDVAGCEKSFYTLFELNRHKKYHSNTRDFVCAYCGKSFHEANHLTVHVRTHTGERPYVCPHCQKGFITRTRCKHHIKLVHQGVGYDLIQSSISKKVTVFETVETLL